MPSNERPNRWELAFTLLDKLENNEVELQTELGISIHPS